MWLNKIIKGVSRDGKQKSKDWTQSIEVGKIRKNWQRDWGGPASEAGGKLKAYQLLVANWRKYFKCFYVFLNLISETPLSIAPMSMSVMTQVKELRLTEVGPSMHSVSRSGLETKPLIWAHCSLTAPQLTALQLLLGQKRETCPCILLNAPPSPF